MQTFSETREFDTVQYQEAVKHEIAAVVEILTRDRESDFHRLAPLFGSVLAANSDFPNSTGSTFPTVHQTYVKLVTSCPDFASLILQRLLPYDPELALTEAEALGLLDSALSESVLADALTSPELVSRAVARYLAGGKNSSRWATALAEAALNYELIAELLVERQPSKKEPEQDILESSRWDLHGPAADSLYGEILRDASSTTGTHLIAHSRGLRRLAIVNLVDAQTTSLAGPPIRRRREHYVTSVESAMEQLLNLAGGRIESTYASMTLLCSFGGRPQVWSTRPQGLSVALVSNRRSGRFKKSHVIGQNFIADSLVEFDDLTQAVELASHSVLEIDYTSQFRRVSRVDMIRLRIRDAEADKLRRQQSIATPIDMQEALDSSEDAAKRARLISD